MKLKLLLHGFEAVQTEQGRRYIPVFECEPIQKPEALELLKKNSEAGVTEVTLQ